MMMLSRLMRLNCHITVASQTSITRWDVPGAFLSPNCIQTKRKSLSCEVRADLFQFSGVLQFASILNSNLASKSIQTYPSELKNVPSLDAGKSSLTLTAFCFRKSTWKRGDPLFSGAIKISGARSVCFPSNVCIFNILPILSQSNFRACGSAR